MRIYLAIFCLLFFLTALSAQNEAPLQMPNPADYLAPGIRYEVLPFLRTDDESRQLFYYDPGTLSWDSYAYPEGVRTMGELLLADGTYLLVQNDPDMENAWIFHPQGTITAAEPLCGYWKVPEENGFWRRGIMDGGLRLCHSGTGQVSDIIALEISPDDACHGVIKLSEELLAFYQCVGATRTLLSYNLRTHSLLRLGSFEGSVFPMIIDEENLLLITNFDFSQSYNNLEYYRVQASLENSAEHLFSLNTHSASIDFSGDNRFIYISENRPSPIQEGDYDGWRLRSYDILTGAEQILAEHDYLSIQDEPQLLKVEYLPGNLLNLILPFTGMAVNPSWAHYAIFDLNTSELSFSEHELRYLFDNYYMRFENQTNTTIFRYLEGELVPDRTLRNLAYVNPLSAYDVLYEGRYLVFRSNSYITERLGEEFTGFSGFNENREMASYFLYDWENNSLHSFIPTIGHLDFSFYPDGENNSLFISLGERTPNDNGGFTIVYGFSGRWRIFLDELP